MQITLGHLVIFACALWLGYRINAIKHKRQQAAALNLSNMAPPPPPAECTPAPARWYPMPCGTRLELGDTGYWIELAGKKGKNPYRGYGPEGDCITNGHNLPQMKALLEEQAAMRKEFEPTKQ